MVFDPKELGAIRHGKAPDFKESFDMGIELADGSERISNIWIPEEDIPGFRQYAKEYFAVCRHFQVTKLLPALAIGMGLDKEFFLPYHATGDNQLRLLHYPEAPVDVFESCEKGRIGAHTVRCSRPSIHCTVESPSKGLWNGHFAVPGRLRWTRSRIASHAWHVHTGSPNQRSSRFQYWRFPHALV